MCTFIQTAGPAALRVCVCVDPVGLQHLLCSTTGSISFPSPLMDLCLNDHSSLEFIYYVKVRYGLFREMGARHFVMCVCLSVI